MQNWPSDSSHIQQQASCSAKKGMIYMNNICVWSSEFPPCEVGHVISRTIFSDQNFLFLWTQSRYQLCQLCPHLLTTNTYKMLISVMALSSRFRMLPAFDRWLRSSFCRTFSISRSTILAASRTSRIRLPSAFPCSTSTRIYQCVQSIGQNYCCLNDNV